MILVPDRSGQRELPLARKDFSFEELNMRAGADKITFAFRPASSR